MNTPEPADAGRTSAVNPGAALRRALMMEELGGLLRDLEGAGVLCAALKGPVLQARLYPPESRRDSSDLDLLIRPSDLDRAQEVLVGRGYAAPDPAARARSLARHYHLYFERPKPPPVELHFKLFGGFAAEIPSEPFLDRSVVLKLDENESFPSPARARVLAPADELFHLLLHAAAHLRDSRWIRDIARWLAIHPDPDWAAVMARARESGTVNAVGWSLEAALAPKSENGAPPRWPEEIPRPRGWRRRAASALEAAAPAAPSARRLILYHYLYEAALADRARGGAKFLAGKLAEPILRRLGR